MSKPEFKNPPLQDDEEEMIHVFKCFSCDASTTYTDQEYKTALIPLNRVKCVCGAILYHFPEYRKKKWVDKNLRNK